MRIFILFLCFFLYITTSIQADSNHVNLYNDFANFIYKKQYSKALQAAETHLKTVDDNPNLGDLADAYIRLSKQQKKDPIPFLLNIVVKKKDYITKERIFLAIADYYKKNQHYYSAIKYYQWIERNHDAKSLVYDDALWSLYQIYKGIGAYNQAINYLNKIINTHQYSIYVASYNQAHLYDAFLAKHQLLMKQNKKGEAIRTLETFVKNFKDSAVVDDALFKLCQQKSKTYCCQLINNHSTSSHYLEAQKQCPNKIK